MIWSSNTTAIFDQSSVEFWSFASFTICMYALNYLLGLPLNAYVVLVLFSGGRRLDLCDVFTLNQAAAEIVFLLLVPFHLAMIFGPESWFYYPVGLILGTAMSARATLQFCVCLERYVAVVHPLSYLRFRPLRYRVALCAVTWTISLASGVGCMVTFPSIPYQVYSAIYFGFTGGSIFTCVSIRNALRHAGPRSADATAAAKKRAYHIVLVNLLMFLAQNIPITVVFGALSTLPHRAFRMASSACLFINLVVGWVQPIFVLRKAGRLNDLHLLH